MTQERLIEADLDHKDAAALLFLEEFRQKFFKLGKEPPPCKEADQMKGLNKKEKKKLKRKNKKIEKNLKKKEEQSLVNFFKNPEARKYVTVLDVMGRKLLRHSKWLPYIGLPTSKSTEKKPITKGERSSSLNFPKEFEICHGDRITCNTSSRNIVKEVISDGFIHLKLIGFGNSCWTSKKYSTSISSRCSRPPEVILGCQYDQSADVWAAGCLFFQCMTGTEMFYPQANSTFSADELHLAQVMASHVDGRTPRTLSTRTDS